MPAAAQEGRMNFRVVMVFLGLIGGAAADEITLKEYISDDTLLRLGTYAFEGGKTLKLGVGIGSGAFHHPADPPNLMWTVGDRGPNFTCVDRRWRNPCGLRGGDERPGLSDAKLLPVDLPRNAGTMGLSVSL